MILKTMENTQKNKERFFGLYINQQVLANTQGVQYPLVDLNKSWNWTHSGFYLELKSLSNITDEDAEGYLHFIGCHSMGERIKQAKQQMKEDSNNDIHLSDYLRFKGYALPFMGLSVEKQIEYGWVKLK